LKISTSSTYSLIHINLDFQAYTSNAGYLSMFSFGAGPLWCRNAYESMSVPLLGKTIFHTFCIELIKLDIYLPSILMHTNHCSCSTSSPMVNSVSNLKHVLSLFHLHCSRLHN
jgi:hypothetical protein